MKKYLAGMKTPRYVRRCFLFGKIQIQRLFITLQFFGENGLANHAAAGAYGFLLSAAPALLFLSFFLLAAFHSSPGMVMELVTHIPFLNSVAGEEWLSNDFTALAQPGIAGLISAAGVFWAGRVFALSLQRGIKVIFTGDKKRNPFSDNLVVILVECMVLFLALVIILCSRASLGLYDLLGFSETALSFLRFFSRIFPVLALSVVSFFVYRIVPANAPRCVSAFYGTAFCVVFYEISAWILGIFLNQARYAFLYGTLGNLIMLLINVYFFFTFFFLGAQLAKVLDSFDAILFSRLREARTDNSPRFSAGAKLFSSTGGKLEKYFRSYRAGETIFSKGESGDDVFFLLEGEVDVYIPSPGNGAEDPVNTLCAGSFFGEMSCLISENRTATIKAKTNLSALALPPPLFNEILKYDVDLGRTIIEHLSQRLKIRNEQAGSSLGNRRSRF